MLFKDIPGDSIIDLALQDHVLIGPGIFPCIYHMGSNFNLYSIISNGLILGGQNLSRRQSVFFLLVTTKIQSISTTLHFVSHDTFKMHGRDIKIRYVGSILILESEKD